MTPKNKLKASCAKIWFHPCINCREGHNSEHLQKVSLKYLDVNSINMIIIQYHGIYQITMVLPYDIINVPQHFNHKGRLKKTLKTETLL